MYIEYENKVSILNLLSDKICYLVSENDFFKTKVGIIETIDLLLITIYTENKSFIDVESYIESMLTDMYELFALNYTIEKLLVKVRNPIIRFIHEDSGRYYETPYWFTFFNSDRPIYSKEQITTYNLKTNSPTIPSVGFTVNEFGGINTNGDIFTTNSFPFGISKSLKIKYYLGELMANDVLRFTKSPHMQFLGLNWGNLHVESKYNSEDVLSCLLDVYNNFDISTFSKVFDNYDFLDEIKNPTKDKPWLDSSFSKLSEFIIF